MANEAKYRRFNRDSHIQAKLGKAKKLLFMTRAAFGKDWGLNPIIMRWIYIAVVRASFTYCCYVWGQVLEFKYPNQVARLQRLALMQLGNFRRGTPSVGRDIITGTIPQTYISKRKS